MDNGNNSNNNKPANEKATQAYKLFSEGKTPVEVAIQLGLSEKEATRYYIGYWRLKRIYGLYQIYQESKGNLSCIMRCRLLSTASPLYQVLIFHACHKARLQVP